MAPATKEQPPADEPATSITTPGTRDGTPIAGTCPNCGRDELVTTPPADRSEKSSSITLCTLCGYELDTGEAKAAKPSSPKRAPAKRASAKRSTAKRSSAKRRSSSPANSKRAGR